MKKTGMKLKTNSREIVVWRLNATKKSNRTRRTLNVCRTLAPQFSANFRFKKSVVS